MKFALSYFLTTTLSKAKYLGAFMPQLETSLDSMVKLTLVTLPSEVMSLVYHFVRKPPSSAIASFVVPVSFSPL